MSFDIAPPPGQLNAAETQLLEGCVEHLSQDTQAPVREWLQTLHSCLRGQGRPLKASDPEEKLQTSRLKKAKEYAKARSAWLGLISGFPSEGFLV